MEHGNKITVEGVSKKGKNRVREHGSCWKIIQKTNKAVLLESVQTQYLRWMALSEDKDFKERK